MLARTLIAALGLTFAGCGGGGNPAGPTPGTPAGPTIGPAGGSAASADGAVRLVVPQGALAAPVPIVLRGTAAVPLDPHAVFRTGFEVAPAGTTFASPAMLTIRYDPSLRPSGTDEAELRLHVLNAGQWEPVPQAGVDVASHEVSAPIRTAGVYGARWAGPSAGCGSAESRQFDFWLGSWTYAAAGASPGTNDISQEGGGCLVEEHFRDGNGTLGRSVSLFSRLDRQWHQTYVDSRGDRIVLVGAWDGRRMVLAEDATRRFLWQQTAPEVVRYWGERSADGGASWNVFFDSTYTRR